MSWLLPTERERWASPAVLSRPQIHLGAPALDAESRELYERALPRNVLMARLTPERPPINYWMRPSQLAGYEYIPGQIILGKFANRYLGYLDDRPMVTIAGARAGKTSTVLEPNLYLYPGSMLVLDPKGELAKTAPVRRVLGHTVHTLDPFGQSGEPSACFNALAELDIESGTIIDDVASITQALIVDDGDGRSRHWIDSARALLSGMILLTMTFQEKERNLVTVRELLCLSYPPLVKAVKAKITPPKEGKRNEEFYNENRLAIDTLLGAMSAGEGRFGGVLAGIGKRFSEMPHNERGSVFSTAAAQTDFLDSLPLRKISRHSDFALEALRSDRPTSIYLSLPIGRAASHFRWLRLIVQMACTKLERMGDYPRERPPILFMMEEMAVLGRMEILLSVAAYLPSFGVKLWGILQDVSQLRMHYEGGASTILGNSGLIQCFSNNDGPTLEYISEQLKELAMPFELRTAFARERFSQLLMMAGQPPAAAMRLRHEDVAAIRAHATGHRRAV